MMIKDQSCQNNYLVKENAKIFYTNYELNDIESDNQQDKIRHIFIEQKDQMAPHIKHYLLFFEDLDYKLFMSDNIISPVLGFNNMQLILTVVQNDKMENTSKLIL